MNLKEKFAAGYKDAMKEKDVVRKNTINLARAAIKQTEIDKKVDLSDEEIVPILQKQVKMRKDALADFIKAGRKDLEETYKKEIEILEAYLPKQLSVEEVRKVIKEIAKDMSISSGKENMGKLMGAVMAKLKGLADGNLVRKEIEEFLKK
ncbi:MAG: GatB/YqeY domain-containing protein [Anaerovoracaceae bacterium]